ncbi:hypothetical protein [Alteromonas sp. AMM-1]|uniref:hypothetical protein n=1 Tax=Alteromonas sp. AMM-1 TaxID=3394233 RepID=UPI0039A6EE0F
MPRYQLTPDAAEDIERLFLFGIERFGVKQATKYLDGFQLRLLLLLNLHKHIQWLSTFELDIGGVCMEYTLFTSAPSIWKRSK